MNDIHEVAVGVSRYDFCLAHPLPVLLAAEVRNGQLIRPTSRDKQKSNPTMVYRTSVGQNLDDETSEPPIRFMLIRGRNPTTDGEPVTQWMSIGRTSRSDLMINDYTISKNHARIHISVGGRHTLEDMGSTNGTWINTHRMTPRDVRPLGDRDTIRFAGRFSHSSTRAVSTTSWLDSLERYDCGHLHTVFCGRMSLARRDFLSPLLCELRCLNG